MKRRPLLVLFCCAVVLICALRAAHAPIFGRPRLSAEAWRTLQGGTQTEVTGQVTWAQVKETSVQWVLRDAEAVIQGRRCRLGKVKVTVLPDTEVNGAVSTAAQGARRAERRAQAPTQVALGAVVQVWGTLSQVERPGNPGQFDAAAYYAAQGIYLAQFGSRVTVRAQGGGFREALHALRSRMAARQAQLMRPASAGVLSAMLLGDRTLLSEESRLNYQIGGISHVLAISGLHISLLGLGLNKGLLFLLFLGPAVRRRRLRQLAAAAGSVAFLVVYCLFVGAPVSAVRAAVMCAALLGGQLLCASYDALSALSLAGLVLLAAQPGSLFSAGFQLSFAAVLGATVVYPLLRRSLPHVQRRADSRARTLLSALQDALLAFAGMQLATLPLVARNFYEVPLWGWVANLLLVPAMGLVMALGAAGSVAALFSLRLGGLLLWPVDQILALFELVNASVRRLPGAVWICGQPALWQMAAYYLGLIFALACLNGKQQARGAPAGQEEGACAGALRGRLRAALFAAAALLILFFRVPAPFSLTMLDVGQGDGLVIRAHRAFFAQTFLVDGGSSDVKQVGKYRLLPYLKSQGIARVDAVFLTHADADHVNGVAELLAAIADRETGVRVGRMVLPAWMKPTGGELVVDSGQRTETSRGSSQRAETGQGTGSIYRSAHLMDQIFALCRELQIPISYVEKGDAIRAGDLQLTVLHPLAHGAGQREGNAGSLLLYLKYRGFTALLTGDLDGAGEQETVPDLPRADVLKVAHHGSKGATSAAFLARVRPSLCLISAPANSRYGHPHAETLSRIRAAGARILVTRDTGAVTVEVLHNNRRLCYTFDDVPMRKHKKGME